jgi:predicted peroxiredoxin
MTIEPGRGLNLVCFHLLNWNEGRKTMHIVKSIYFSIFVVSLLLAGQAKATEDKSMGLFINLTTEEVGASGHAVQFADKMMKRGHPVTFFINQHAVLFATKNAPQGIYGPSGKTVRDMLLEAMKNGAKVIVCQVCAKMQGIHKSDLIHGAQLGNPDIVTRYLFDPKNQVISW